MKNLIYFFNWFFAYYNSHFNQNTLFQISFAQTAICSSFANWFFVTYLTTSPSFLQLLGTSCLWKFDFWLWGIRCLLSLFRILTSLLPAFSALDLFFFLNSQSVRLLAYMKSCYWNLSMFYLEKYSCFLIGVVSTEPDFSYILLSNQNWISKSSSRIQNQIGEIKASVSNGQPIGYRDTFPSNLLSSQNFLPKSLGLVRMSDVDSWIVVLGYFIWLLLLLEQFLPHFDFIVEFPVFWIFDRWLKRLYQDLLVFGVFQWQDYFESSSLDLWCFGVLEL